MATLSRLVLGSELAQVLTKIESNATFTYRLFQLGGTDKYRIVVHLGTFNGDWSYFDLPAPKDE